MVKKRGTPINGELVICRIEKINPNSAFAVLEEYGIEGMIHISEVSSGWVRDIRNYLKAGQTVIAKVMRAEGGSISLSIKRVDKKQQKEKMREHNLNQKAEKMLEIAAKKTGKSLEQAYEEVGYALQENFGSLYEGFKKSLQRIDALRSRGINEKWLAVLKEVAEKNIEQKEFEFRAQLFIKTYKPNGIHIIKSILKEAQSAGLEVKYITAPEYLVRYRTKQAKKGEKDFLAALERIRTISKDAEIDFKTVS